VKVVLDTHVLLSGLMYPNSTPERIVAAWRSSATVLGSALLGLTCGLRGVFGRRSLWQGELEATRVMR
jgi:hypothetical protein